MLKVIKIILIAIIIIILWFLAIQFVTAEKYKAVVNVVKAEGTMGVNPSTESLDFGDLSRGASATRYLNLNNQGKNKISIRIWVLGEIKNLIKVDKNKFILAPGESTRVNFKLTVPVSAQAREYQGKVYIFKMFTF